MSNIKNELEGKTETALDEVREYHDRIGVEIEEPWRIRLTGWHGAFEALFQYSTNSIVLNDAETPDDEYGAAMFHEFLHNRHANKAFGELSQDHRNQVIDMEQAHQSMAEEAIEEGINVRYVEPLEELNFVADEEIPAAAFVHDGNSIEDVSASDASEIGSEKQARETFPLIYERREKFNDVAWRAASEVVAGVDYHFQGWIDDLPKSAIIRDVKNNAKDSVENIDTEFTSDEVASYAANQTNYWVSIHEKLSDSTPDTHDKLIGRIIRAGDNMFEDYESWNGLPPFNEYLNEELNIG